MIRSSNNMATPEHEPVLTRVEDIVPQASNHGDVQACLMVNPNLQRELALVEHLVVAGKDADIPFTPYLTKCQRKKIAQKCYQTRSMGPPPTISNEAFLLEYSEVLGIGFSNCPW